MTILSSSSNPTRTFLRTSIALAALLTGAAPALAADAPLLNAGSGFTVLSAAPAGRGAVTCTDAAIVGAIGSSGFPNAVVKTRCALNGRIVAPVSIQVLANFNAGYVALGNVACNRILTGTLAGVRLAPGVYCFDAAAALTGTLTLAGPPTGTWIFRIGTHGAGTLTGKNFTVVMANGAQACGVYWRVTNGTAMTTSNLKGTVLSGGGTTFTGGTLTGRAMAKAGVTLTNVAVVGCGSSSGVDLLDL